MKTKVLFIGDVSRGNQAENIYKLFRLFSPIFMHAEVECAIYVSPVNKLIEFPEWFDSWHACLRDQGTSPLAALELSNTAVVGFEIPEGDLAYLSQQKVPWVNLEIHPLRFLDDLYFSIASSFDYDLKPLSVGSGLINFCANAIRIRYGRVEQNVPAPALAIFGQTPFDKNIFFDGSFKLLDSYFDQVDRLAKEHQRVLYRPHPYLTDAELDKEICRRYEAQICTERDVYKFFSSGHVATVCAISSSAIFEAPFFGVRGVLLEPRAKHYGVPVSYVRLLDEQMFWFRGLLGVDDNPYPSIGQAVPTNFLRNTFGYWGYVTREQEIEAQLVSLGIDVQQAEARATQAEACATQAEARLADILNSKTWHLTAPLRWAIRQFRALQRWLQ